MLQGYKAPDYATISRFHKDYLSNEVVEDLFYCQVNYLVTQNKILLKFTKQLTEYKEKQDRYNFSKNLFSKRNSYSESDPDATFMHMKVYHMRNYQLKPAHNVQIADLCYEPLRKLFVSRIK